MDNFTVAPYNLMYDAIETSDTSGLESLLASLPPNTLLDDPRPLGDALVLACNKGRTNCVQALLKYGMDPNPKDCYGNTPLILAAEKGHTDVVAMLLDSGCYVNSTDTETRTALHWAAMNGHSEIANMLLSNSALPDLPDKIYKFTPLMLAARQGHASIVQDLLHCNCRVNSADIHGETALFDAVRNDQSQCLHLLLNAGANVDHTDKYGRTCILTAVLWNRANAVRALTYANCRLDLSGRISFISKLDTRTRTPLEASILEGNAEICRVLIQAGASREALYRYSRSGWLLQMATVMEGPDRQLYVWLLDLIKQTPSLLELCRTTVRKFYGQSLQTALPNLAIPNTLKEYLTVPELLHSRT